MTTVLRVEAVSKQYWQVNLISTNKTIAPIIYACVLRFTSLQQV